LSQLKFSSNVIEKCLDSKLKSETINSEPYIDKIFKGTFEDDDNQIINEFGYKTDKSKSLKPRISFMVQKLIYN